MSSKPDPNREFLAAAVETLNEERREVDVVFFTGRDIPRTGWDGAYTLRFDPEGADLSYLNSRAPVLDNHSAYEGATAQKGVVEKAWRDGRLFKARLRFSKRPEVDGLWQDIADKIVTKFSMGVEILEKKETEGARPRVVTATKWRPFELSVVPVPADFGTTTLKHESAASAAKGEHHMSDTTKSGATEAAAVTTNPDAELIRKTARVCNLSAFGEDLIAKGTGINEARAALIDRMAEQSASNGPVQHVRAEVTRDGREGMAAAMGEALACRYTGQQPGERAREYVGATVADLARICCQSAGVPVTGFGAERYIRLALHSTSDFPALTTEAGTRLLLAAYQAAQPAIKRVARRSTAPDFRTKSALRLGGAPKLIKVPESGEVTSGSRAEAKESYRIYSFGRIFGITREALINDDLGAFADFARAYGVAAANLEAQELVDLLYGEAGVGPTMNDTKALFHEDHGNLAAAPGAISDTTFSAARLALRTAKDLDGETVIETAPRYLLVPAALETTAEKYLAVLYPAQASDVNPFTGKFELLVEPRLDAKSVTAWWIFGEPSAAPVLEYSYLGDAQGPMIDSRPGFEVLGLEVRCVLDYGVGAIGWRGGYKGNN